MFDVDSQVRKNIKSLSPYSSARDEFSGVEGVFLDANENPFGNFNRYPDPYQKELKNALSQIKGIPVENLFLGNGSDEVIDLLFRIFCKPGLDKALTFSPTYGMYQVSAELNDVELMQQPLNQNFQIDFESLNPLLSDQNLKLIFICSPNNPTGNSIRNVKKIIESFHGIVVVDEAYIDFSHEPSWTKRIHEFPNLVVLQTLSKAWGLAAIRLGIGLSNIQIIKYLNKVKPPYNISQPNQEAALLAIKNVEVFEQRKQKILEQKEWLMAALLALKPIKKVYPSDANFVLVQVEDADILYNQLIAEKIITRNRNKQIPGCLRITIGTELENQKLINAITKLAL